MTGRVLVARLDSMGDVLLAGPAVRAVAAQAEVVLLCSPRGEAAGMMLPGASRVLTWEAPWILDPAPPVRTAAIDRLVSLVRSAEIDEAVILTSFHQSPLPLALLLRLAGVPRLTGASVDYPGSLLDVRLRPGEDLAEDIPESERALAIAAAAGFPCPDDGDLRVRPTSPAFRLTGSAPYFVLHPGAAVPARRWPVDGFVAAARILTERGHRAVLTGGSGERELTGRIARQVPDVLDLGGACSLPELAGVLAGGRALISGNTGPAHLAAAVGTPVVSLFSPVVPAEKWAPYRVPRVLFGDQDAPCRGTRARECPVPGHPCLSSVEPEDVVAAAVALAEGRSTGPSPKGGALA